MPEKKLSEDMILAYLVYNEKRGKFQIYTLSEEEIREDKNVRLIKEEPYYINRDQLEDIHEIAYLHKGGESELVEIIENIFGQRKSGKVQNGNR